MKVLCELGMTWEDNSIFPRKFRFLAISSFVSGSTVHAAWDREDVSGLGFQDLCQARRLFYMGVSFICWREYGMWVGLWDEVVDCSWVMGES